MQRSHYVHAFVALATVFVPVLVYFGFTAFIVPTVWVLGSAATNIFSSDWRLAIGFLVYSALYLTLFYGLARFSFWLFSLPRNRTVRITLQSAALLGLFACSFLHQLTYGSMWGRGGTYTFWTAAARYFERHHHR